jgi:hypothetical protein
MPAPPRPPDNLFLPRERRWSWIAIAVSLVFHASVFLIKTGAYVAPREPVERIVLVPLGTEGPRAVEMVYRDPSGGGNRSRTKTSGISALPRPETGPTPEQQPVPDTVVAAADEPRAPDSAPATPGRPRGRAHMGPALGEGKLWVRPLPLPPQDLARAVTRTRAEIADSVVTVIVQAYIDSVLATAPDNAPIPSWTTKVGDQQLGIDSRWIYLGPIKIPTALLALILPSVSSAEMSDYTKFRQLQQMRADVQIAARRAERMDDFKRAIRELRAQREREREFAKNQRTAPKKDSTGANPP